MSTVFLLVLIGVQCQPDWNYLDVLNFYDNYEDEADGPEEPEEPIEPPCLDEKNEEFCNKRNACKNWRKWKCLKTCGLCDKGKPQEPFFYEFNNDFNSFCLLLAACTPTERRCKRITAQKCKKPRIIQRCAAECQECGWN